MTRHKMIAFIKSHSHPPYEDGDLYFQRYPWNKFGAVSSGICECWCWFKDFVIEEKATDIDVETAYQAIKGMIK